MPENPRIPLPFGQFLDRETGVMAMRPGTMEDLRNVLNHQGKAIIRPGFDSTVILLDDEDNATSHLLQGFSLRSERVGVTVSWQETTEKVWVHRIDTLGLTAELIGEWENDLGWGSSVPKVSMTEVRGRVFMAHDTRYVNERAGTIYYHPTGATVLTDLEGDFLGAGTHKIRFRGVVRHLKYLFGWGYGTESVDRPDMVRSSRALDPTDFNKAHYFQAGDQGDPVMTCKPAEGRLLVFKEVETHVIVGTGRDSFGIHLLDPLYGCVGTGLAANRGKVVVAWSAEGPRGWDGLGPSEELALDLELAGAEPPGLVTEGASETAFAAYIPELRVMAFYWGLRVYALTMRVQGAGGWSYWELETDVPLCGFTLYPGAQDTEAPTGFPAMSGIISGGTYSDYEIVNWNQDGDETLEIWLSEDSGAWFLAKSVLVSPTSGANQTPTPRVTGLTPGTSYRVAVRYRRGTLYTAGYTDADPWNWPSVSRATYNTAIAPPTWVSGVWSRTSAIAEQILLTVTPAVGQEAQDIEVYRNTILVNTISGPHVGDATWADTGFSPETDVTYEFLTVGGTGDSIKSDPEDVWGGPADIPAVDWVLSAGSEGYEVGVIPGDVADPTEVWDNYDDAGGTGAPALRFTLAAAVITGDSGALVGLSPTPPGVLIDIKMRHKETAFAVDDFSDFSAVTQLYIFQEP